MFRGFLSGVIWGAVAVVIVVAVASLLAPLPATVVPQTSAAEMTAGSDKQGTAPITGAPQTDESPAAEAAAGAEASEDDDTPLADTDPAPKPEPAQAQQSLTAPEAGADDSGLGAVGEPETPVMPMPQVQAPEAPEVEPEVASDPESETSITTNPDQPDAPVVPEVGSAFETPAPEADLSPDAESPEATEVEPSPLMKPAGTLTDAAGERKSTRLPTVGEVEEDTQAPRPFDINAEPFEAPEGKPLMSVVLIDSGKAPVDTAQLSGLPFPVSFAINTLLPDAAAREASYRAMGYETLAMIDIPAQAAAADVEVAMEAHLSALPGAVGVLEGTVDGLQGTRDLSDQVTEVLLASGHGLVMFANGLNTAQKLASREGVPAATVFRDFDGKGQSAVVMRRFLDQAAFKADQEGGVIMVGRLREETLSALMVWGLQDRAGTVSLAPVSAVLRAKQP